MGRAKKCSVRRYWSSVSLAMKCKQSRNSRNWNGCCRKILDLQLCGKKNQLFRPTMPLEGAEDSTYALLAALPLKLISAELFSRAPAPPGNLISSLRLAANLLVSMAPLHTDGMVPLCTVARGGYPCRLLLDEAEGWPSMKSAALSKAAWCARRGDNRAKCMS